MTIIEHEPQVSTTQEEDLNIEVGTWRMDPSLKQRWVTALRSGKYKQGKIDLKNRCGEFCALGVLCDVAGIADPTWESYSWIGNTICGPIADIYEKNDDGWTFAELADYIEENY